MECNQMIVDRTGVVRRTGPDVASRIAIIGEVSSICLIRPGPLSAQSTQRDEVERAINDALQTPMQLAADTIISLIKKLSDDDNDEAAIPLAQVLKQISSGTDMYQPKMLNVR